MGSRVWGSGRSAGINVWAEAQRCTQASPRPSVLKRAYPSVPTRAYSSVLVWAYAGGEARRGTCWRYLTRAVRLCSSCHAGFAVPIWQNGEAGQRPGSPNWCAQHALLTQTDYSHRQGPQMAPFVSVLRRIAGYNYWGRARPWLAILGHL